MRAADNNISSLDCLLFVSKQTGVDVDNIAGSDSSVKFVKARYLYCVLARECTGATLKAIGKLINKHYTSVIYYRDNIQYWKELNEEYIEIKKQFIKRYDK